jgi:hypothetical protein
VHKHIGPLPLLLDEFYRVLEVQLLKVSVICPDVLKVDDIMYQVLDATVVTDFSVTHDGDHSSNLPGVEHSPVLGTSQIA